MNFKKKLKVNGEMIINISYSKNYLD